MITFRVWLKEKSTRTPRSTTVTAKLAMVNNGGDLQFFGNGPPWSNAAFARGSWSSFEETREEAAKAGLK